VNLPAATCSGTISIASAAWFHAATSDGKVYNGCRPADLHPDYNGYFLMYNPFAAGHGNLYRLASNGVINPVDVVANQALGSYVDSVDMTLLSGPAVSLPARIRLHVSVLDGNAVQAVEGWETTNAGLSIPLAGKRLVTSTGLASSAVPWNCALAADPSAVFRITVTITGNTIIIKGADIYDGRAGGVAFTLSGKIFREYDSSRCDFKVIGYNSTVREARGCIDGDRISLTIRSKSPPGSPTAGQWLENEAIGFKAP
jgi:hypothetical protein